MSRTTKISHKFVQFIPEVLEPDVLYVSIPYRTASHLCMCGCGKKVVTPIRPERWQLNYDGVAISLMPSIGNWDLPCRSHYWITKDTVQWSYEMDKPEVDWIKNDEIKRLREYYAQPLRRPRLFRRRRS